jgi:putative oxidoreductase
VHYRHIFVPTARSTIKDVPMSNQTFAETATAPSAIPSAVTTLVPALGRVMISTLFILAGVSKLAAPAMTIGYMVYSSGTALSTNSLGICA